GVLTNDTDADGNTLSVASPRPISGPSHGSLTLNADGTFTYTPNANYNGPDSFTYRATDGAADSNVATVSITVNPVNDAPVAVNHGAVRPHATHTCHKPPAPNAPAPGARANAGGVARPALTAVLVSGPSHGSLTLNGDGSFTYTPAANYNGPDSFTYKANDGQ